MKNVDGDDGGTRPLKKKLVYSTFEDSNTLFDGKINNKFYNSNLES